MILSSRVKERKSKKESNIDHLFFFFPFFPLDLVWRGLGELVTELSLASVVSGQELLRVTPPRHSLNSSLSVSTVSLLFLIVIPPSACESSVSSRRASFRSSTDTLLASTVPLASFFSTVSSSSTISLSNLKLFLILSLLDNYL